MSRKCRWPEGCDTLLSHYNRTDLCGVHQQKEVDSFIQKTSIPPRDMSHAISGELEIVPNEPAVEKVLRAVCSSYGISMEELLSPRRYAHIVFPRQVAAYILRVEVEVSFPKIAKILKRKDHTTIIHACKKITSLVNEASTVRKNIEELRAFCKPPA